MKPSRNAWLVAGAVMVGVLRYAMRASVPDDYDSVGFTLALDHFDLARFQPHFPGYPVYVALGRVVHLVFRSPFQAAVATSSLASAATAIGVWLIAARIASERAAFIAMAIYGVASMPWILGGGALSDGTAAALAVFAFAALLEDRPVLGGVLLGLMLGARASYFPLALSWLVIASIWKRAHLARACAGSILGVLAWAIPFVIIVGPRALIALGRVHVRGHFSTWGGTVKTRPDLSMRFVAFFRDWFFDGIAPNTLPLIALVVIALAAWKLRRPAREALSISAIIVVPYALWAFFAQNIVEQPRHLLPLVVATTIALGCVLADDLRLAFAATAVIAFSSSPLAVLHARTLPAAAQAAEYVASLPTDGGLVTFGGRAIRLMRYAKPKLRTRERTWLSEVQVDLERFDVLPRHVLVTTEVEADPRRASQIKKGPVFCRDARLDRTRACLGIDEYDLGLGNLLR